MYGEQVYKQKMNWNFKSLSTDEIRRQIRAIENSAMMSNDIIAEKLMALWQELASRK